MSLTISKIGLLALGYNGIQSYDPAAAGPVRKYVTHDGLEVITAINGAIQELFTRCPRWASSRPCTLEVHAPRTGTITATSGSTVIAGGDGFFTPGKTIRLAGDSLDNELVSATELLFAHQGDSGATVAYSLYCDAIALPTGVNQVGPPVWLHDIRKLEMAATFEELLFWDVQAHHNYGLDQGITRQRRSVQSPLAYYVEPFYNRTSFASRLRLSPIPDQRYVVHFKGIMGPPAYTTADLAGAGPGYADPGVTPAIPHDKIESVLLPVVLQHYSGSATFANEKARAEIGRRFAFALESLKLSRPQAFQSPPLLPNNL